MRKFWVLLLFLILLSGFANAISTDEINAYYKGDDTSNYDDATGNHTNGTITGAVTSAGGIINNAWDFSDGGDNIALGYNSPTGSFTVCAWIDYDSLPDGDAIIYADSSAYTFLALDTYTGACQAGRVCFATYDTNYDIVVSTTSYGAGYMFVCGVHDQSLGINGIYIDGISENNISAGNIAGSSASSIGGNTLHDFDGRIDEFQLWDKVLSGSEIYELYNSGAGLQYPFTTPPTANISFHKVKIINRWNSSNIVGVNVTLNNTISNLTQGDGIAYFNNLSGSFDFNATFPQYFNISGTAEENTTVTYNMTQSQLNISVTELITGNQVSNVSIYVDGNLVINTTQSWGLIYPNNGSYTVTSVIDNSGADTLHLTNTTFNVSFLDNKTHTVRVHQHVINVTAKNIINNASISNFSLFVNDLNISSNRTFNTSVGWIEVPLIHNSYNISILADGFATVNNDTVINVSVDVNYTFFLFEVNSISFTIFDLDNLSLVNITIDIEMIGSTVTYDFNASNGSAFINDLNNDTYQITFTGSGYDPTILFATINNGDHLDITVFMADNGIVDFIVQNQLGDLQGNVTLTFTQVVNGSFVTIGQVLTDFSGRASIFLDSTIRYTFFAVKSGFNTFTGEVLPTQPQYTIIIEDLGVERFVSIFDDLRVTTTFTHIPLDDNATANLILNSAEGSLEFYGMNSTYNGNNYFVNTSGFPAGGIETFIILNISPSVEPTVFINYWFKYVGHSLQEWNATYLVSDVVPVNMTIEAGLFDDLDALDRTNPIRGLMGAFIILALILLFSTSKDMTITSIGGIIGLGLNWKFSLMPQALLSVSMIVLGILILADNIGGGR